MFETEPEAVVHGAWGDSPPRSGDFGVLPTAVFRKLLTVDLWTLPLAANPSVVSSFAAALSEDEQRRAERFCFDRDRDRFILARGQLRALLGTYLGTAPVGIRFVYGPHGKPEVMSSERNRAVQFNLSHSREIALCAVTTRRRVGVDVEWVAAADWDFAALAEHCFSLTERLRVHAAEGPARREVFFRIWTRKEACLKGRGYGLAGSLKDFEVPVDYGPVQAPGIPGRWRVCEVPMVSGYLAAVAIEDE